MITNHPKAPRALVIAVAIAASVLLPGPPARADQPASTEQSAPQFLGPVETTNQRPYQLLFLSFPPQSAAVLGSGRQGTTLKLDIGYDYLDPDPAFGAIVKEETETERFEYAESRGFGHGWEGTVSIPIIWRNGGFLGALVGPYHDLIHFNAPTIDAYQGRGHDALFHSLIYDQHLDGTVAVDAGPAFGLGDTSFYLKKSMWSSTKTGTHLSARLGLKAPTGDASQLLGSGGVDEGVDVDLTQRVNRKLAVHAGWNRIWMQKATKLDNTAPTVTGYDFAVEWHPSPHASWLIQTQGTETQFRTENTFADSAPRIAGIGYKWMQGPDTLWTLAWTQGGDYQTFHWPGVSNIGPDFTISINMVRTR